ncbi:hypothetical protein, partial [Mycobacterium avium]|uniref:hypothetical protein n=1 Tax=Mycobacterium avium TaxID=1764 RepID=UPI001CDADB23
MTRRPRSALAQRPLVSRCRTKITKQPDSFRYYGDADNLNSTIKQVLFGRSAGGVQVFQTCAIRVKPLGKQAPMHGGASVLRSTAWVRRVVPTILPHQITEFG